MQMISHPDALASLCAELKGHLAADPRLAIDTEFIRERTYRPVLEVIQLATADGRIALIDVPAVGALDPLGTLLLDPAITKIVHAGGQDVEILTLYLGQSPINLFDTQAAAAFVGFGLQTGYGNLVQALLRVRLSKEEGFADWSRRPLTPAMLAYAADDVRYLHTLHDLLTTRLAKRSRHEWAQEQMERMLTSAAEGTPDEDLWKKVGGKQGLGGRELAVLQELARWRDTEAQRRDKPRRSVLKDEPLVEIARRKPKTPEAVLELRAVHGVGSRQAAEIVEAVKRGLAVPEAEWPRVESQPPLDENGAALLEVLSAVVKVRALEEDLPPSLLAPADALRTLAIQRRKPDFSSILFTGWRGEILGEALKKVLTGTLSVAWDPKRGHLVCRESGE